MILVVDTVSMTPDLFHFADQGEQSFGALWNWVVAPTFHLWEECKKGLIHIREGTKHFLRELSFSKNKQSQIGNVFKPKSVVQENLDL